MAWKTEYIKSKDLNEELMYNPGKIIIDRLFNEKIQINITEITTFDSRNFNNIDEMTFTMKNVYRN